jgi:hypothetical protein
MYATFIACICFREGVVYYVEKCVVITVRISDSMDIPILFWRNAEREVQCVIAVSTKLRQKRINTTNKEVVLECLEGYITPQDKSNKAESIKDNSGRVT